MIVYLSIDAVIQVHDFLIKRYGGLSGIRDRHVLLSSLAAPMMTAFQEEVYPSVVQKAAAYLYYIVKSHPFNDGNKRTGSAVLCGKRS